MMEGATRESLELVAVRGISPEDILAISGDDETAEAHLADYRDRRARRHDVLSGRMSKIHVSRAASHESSNVVYRLMAEVWNGWERDCDRTHRWA